MGSLFQRCLMLLLYMGINSNLVIFLLGRFAAASYGSRVASGYFVVLRTDRRLEGFESTLSKKKDAGRCFPPGR